MIGGSSLKRLIRTLMLSALFCVASALSGLFLLYHWGDAAKMIETPQDIYLSKGSTLDEVAGILESQGLIDHAILFKLWVKLKGSFQSYQAGTYRFGGKVSPFSIDEAMKSGKIFTPIVLQYVIPEGFTLRQILERLAARGVGKFEHMWRLAHDRQFIGSLGLKKAKSLEGYLYPATYSFVAMPSPEGVLKHMVDAFWSKIPSDYVERVTQKGLTLHQAVIFASLIEKETMIDAEMPKVAEVIWRRLKAGEPLGIDAAIIYGIKDYRGDIKWKHLRDRSNPFNTRVHKGLPPGPIGTVSLSSLLAVLNPTNEGYYYYVLKTDNTGLHHFSKTLEEHNRYVQLLIESNKQ